MTDPLGSTRMVLNGSGVATEMIDYQPFREEIRQGVFGRGSLYPAGFPNAVLGRRSEGTLRLSLVFLIKPDMLHEIESWIDAAASTLRIPIERLPKDRAALVETEARSRFVIDQPRVWWLSLAQPCNEYDSKTIPLHEVLPAAHGPCWLIPETGDACLRSIRLTRLISKRCWRSVLISNTISSAATSTG